jgi:hypothetical protein
MGSERLMRILWDGHATRGEFHRNTHGFMFHIYYYLKIASPKHVDQKVYDAIVTKVKAGVKK